MWLNYNINLQKEGTAFTKFEKQKIRWEKQKIKGKPKHILQIVAIYEIWALLCATMQSFFDHHPALSVLSILIGYIINILFWGIAGIITANIGWNTKLKKFEK